MNPFSWIRRKLAAASATRASVPHTRPRSWDRYLLQLETLESRVAPATHTWVGLGTGATALDWSNPANWDTPLLAAEVNPVLEFPANLSHTDHFTSIDNVPGLTDVEIHFFTEAGTVSIGSTVYATAGAGPNGYTIAGSGLLPGVGLQLGGAGVTVDANVAAATDTTFVEDFASSLPITLGASIPLTDSSTSAQVTINGSIGLGASALDITNTNAAGQDAIYPSADARGFVNLNGAISDTAGGGSIIHDGIGTLVFAAGVANTYGSAATAAAPSTIVHTGEVLVNDDNSLGSNTGVLEIDNGDGAETDAGRVILVGGLTVQQAQLNLNGDADGGSLTADGGTNTFIGNIVLDSNNSANSEFPSFGAGLTTSAASAATRLVVNPTSAPGGPYTISNTNPVTSIEINGTGTVEFGQDNTFTVSDAVRINGLIPANAGFAYGNETFQIDSADAAGNPANLIRVEQPNAPNANTLLVNGNFTVPNPLELAGLGVDGAGAVQNTPNASPTLGGTISLDGAVNIGVNGTFADHMTTTGVIQDGTSAGVLTKVGTGTLIVAGAAANTYTGGTVISTGIIDVENTSANPVGATAGLVTVDDGATLQLEDVTGPITIPNAVSFLATGSTATHFAAGADASLEDVATTGGTATNVISGNITLPNPTSSQITMAVDQAGDVLSLSGVISGPSGAGTGGGIIVNLAPPAGSTVPTPAGELQFAGAGNNLYGGSTNVDAGTLDLAKTGGAFAIPNPGATNPGGGVTIGIANPATADTTAFFINAVLSFEGTNEIETAAKITINPTGDLEEHSFSQTIGALNMIGGTINVHSFGAPNTLVLTASVTATGYIDSHGTFSPAIILEPTNEVLDVQPGGTGFRTFTVTATPGKVAGEADFQNFASISDGTGTPSGLDMEGTGEMLLSETGFYGFPGPASTYTGGTKVGGGALEVLTDTALGAAASTVTVSPFASLIVGDGASLAQALVLNGPGLGTFGDNESLQGGDAVGLGAGTWAGPITLNGTGVTIGAFVGDELFLSGLVENGTAATPGLTVQDAGEVVMDGDVANTYTGLTTVAAPAELFLNDFAFPAGVFTPLTAVPGNIVIDGEVLVFDGYFLTDPGVHNAGIEIGTLAAPSTVTIAGTGTETAGATSGALILDGTVQLSIGTLTTAGGLIDLTAAGSQLQLGSTVTSNAAATTFEIDGDNGTPTTSLLLESPTTFSTAANTVGLPVDFDIDAAIGDPYTGGIGSVIKTGAGVLQYSGAAANVYTGNTTVDTGTLLLNKSAAFGTFGSAIPVGTTLTIGTGAGTPGSVLVEDTTGTGAANWQLGGIHSGGADVVINSDGVLDLNTHEDRIAGNGGNALTMTGGSVTLGFGGELFLDGNVLVNAGPTAVITGPATGLGVEGVNLDGATRTFNTAAGANLTISADMFNGGLTKAGAGSVSLNGDNSYGGVTTINGGELFVNDDQPQSVVDVGPATTAATATLGGIGTVGTVDSVGGIIKPGDSPGILNVSGDVTLDAASTFSAILDSTTAGSGYSQLIATGAVTIDTGATLVITVGGVFPARTVFTLIEGSSVTGTFSNLVSGIYTTSLGQQLQITNTGTAIIATVLIGTTSTGLTASPTAGAVYEQPITLTAVVQFPTGTVNPGGTVTFYDNGTQIGQVPVTGNFNSSTDEATVSITDSTAPVGTNNFTATYSGDSLNNGSTLTLATYTIARAQPTLVFSTPPIANPVFEQPDTATVTMTVLAPSTDSPVVPSGSITFTATNNATGSVSTLGTVTLNGSTAASAQTASINLSTLTPGSYTISASYAGDANFASATATTNPVVVVTKAATTLSLTTPPPATFTFETPESITATVAVSAPSTGQPTIPTGFVTFTATNTSTGTQTALATVGLNGGYAATVSLSSLAPGSYTITATYGGDTNYAGSSTTSSTTVVTQATTTLTFTTPPPATAIFEQPVIVTVAVAVLTTSSGTPIPPGGFVTFTATPTTGAPISLGAVAVSGGQASVSLSSLPPGSYTITATYSGDANYAAATVSDPETVTQATTTLAFTTPPPATAIFEQPDTVTVAVSVSPPSSNNPVHPSGSVAFTATNTSTGLVTSLATVALNGNTASADLSSLAPGSYTITATYSGDGNFMGSSTTAPLTVTQAVTVLTFTQPPPATAVFEQPVSVTASFVVQPPSTGSPVAPTGFIAFTATNTAVTPNVVTNLGDVGLNGGQAATISLSSLAPGTYIISATYSGDGNFAAPAAAITAPEVVTQAQTSTAFTTAPPGTAGFEQPETATVAVSVLSPSSNTPVHPTGTIAFTATNTGTGLVTSLGSVPLNGNQASVNLSNLPPGTYTIAATYNGDTNFAGSAATTVTEIVTAAPVTTTITAPTTAESVFAGLPVTVSATVAVTGPSTGAPTAPTGFVSFTATNTVTGAQTALGTGALNGNQASVSPTSLAVGTYTFTATYLGDGNFAASPASVSSAVVTVNPAVVATGGSAISATVGASLTATVATFTDPTGPQSLGTYSASINWGDGTAPSAGTITLSGTTFSVAGTHTYSAQGSFTVTTTITRAGAPIPVSVTAPATATFPAVTINSVFPVSASIGRDTGTITLATFTDPSGPDLISNYSASINWGDGTAASTGIIGSNGNGTFSVSGDHTYAAKGTFTVIVTVNHLSAPPATSVKITATVSASTINITTLTPQSTIAVGAGFVGLVGTFTDSNPSSTAANFVVGVYWGDGSFSIGQLLALGLDANGNQVFGVYSFHTYTTAGSLSFAMGVYDVDGAQATASTGGGAVTVYTPGTEANLVAYNTLLVNAVAEYNTYNTLALQTGANYATFLAQYWLSVVEANENAYNALVKSAGL